MDLYFIPEVAWGNLFNSSMHQADRLLYNSLELSILENVKLPHEISFSFKKTMAHLQLFMSDTSTQNQF